MKINIEQVQENHIQTVVDFVVQSRKLLFPMLTHDTIPLDLLHFETTYLHNSQGCFLIAKSASDHIVACIGMKAYDHRFQRLNYQDVITSEVVKLFVDPAYRRNGLATELLAKLKSIAFARGIGRLYLHTHPFLTGAYEFWLHCGFQFTYQEVDPIFQTIHMEMSLLESANTKM
ncbi:GNAT family N-acetyltransferase [Olivibacter sp. SA151]|uniref:GNAT family N-acetyltransferase n=1 Tax=Olivibacter jilunii TaxID=985016 RepID=UPI003F164AA3